LRRIAWILIAGFAAGAIALGAWLASIDRDELREKLVSNLSKSTGYGITIRGPLELHLLPHPAISVASVRIANPVKPSENALAKAAKIEVEIDLLASLRKRILILGSIQLHGAEIWLEQNEHGQKNWILPSSATLDAPQDSSPARIDLMPKNLELQNLKVHFKDALSRRSLDFSFHRASAHQSGDDQRIQLDVRGQMDQNPFHLSGTVKRLKEKQANDVPLWHSDLRLDVAQGAALLKTQGTLGRIPALDGLDLSVSLSSPKPADFARQLGGAEAGAWAEIAGPIQLKCRVRKEEKNDFSLQEVVLEMGDSKRLTISASGKIQNLIDGKGLEFDIQGKTPDLGRALKPTGLPDGKLGEARFQATLKGDADSPRAESLDLRLKSPMGIETQVRGDLRHDGQAFQGDLQISMEAPDLVSLAKSVSNLAPDNAAEIAAVLQQREDRPLLDHILSLAPVSIDLKAQATGSRWGFDQLDARVGRKDDDWIHLSGKASTLWPQRDGVEIRLRTHLHEPGRLPGLADRPVAQIQSLRGTGVFAQGKDLPARIREIDIQVQADHRVNLQLGGSILLDDAGPRESGHLRFRIGAQTLAAVARTWGGSMPEWGPLNARGELVGSLEKLRLQNFKAGLAKTQIAGSGELNRSTEIPEVDLALQVNDLDLREFQTGATPSKVPDPNSSPRTEEKTNSPTGSEELLGPKQFPWLSSTKGSLEIQSGPIVLDNDWKVRNLVGRVRWADGLLRGPDLRSTWSKGHLILETTLDVKKPEPQASLALTSTGLHADSLAKWMGQPNGIEGSVEAVIDLTSHGAALDDVVSNLNGDLLIDIRDGRLAARYADAVALSLKSAPRTEFVAMSCFIGAMEIQKGVGQADPLLWDAPSQQVRAMGIVNFTDRTLDILLRPHLKDTIATAITAAVRVKGPFDRPKVSPEPLRTATDLARGLIGRTLGMVTNVSPQVADAMAHLQASADQALSATGVEVPVVTELLREPVTCESVSADPRVKALRSFKPPRSLPPPAAAR